MRWRRSPQTLWRTAPGYLVLGTLDGRTLEIEGPGGEVWARLEGWVSEDELAGDLARHFATDPQVVSADVRTLLRELHGRGYVERDG